MLSAISIGAGALLIPMSLGWVIYPLDIGLLAPLLSLCILISIQFIIIKATYILEVKTRKIEASFSEFLRSSALNVIFYNVLFLLISIITVLIVSLGENMTLFVVGGNIIILSMPALILNWPGGLSRPIKGFREMTQEVDPEILSVVERSGLQIHLIGFLPLRKMKVINAYQYGSKKNAVIAVSDYLEQILTKDEIAGIVAHELGHIKNHHFTKLIITIIISPFILINLYYLDTIFNIEQYLNEFQNFLVLMFYGFFGLGVPIIDIPWVRRRWELQADLYAANLVGADIFASALKKLVDNEVVFWKVDKRIEFLLTHPSISNRVGKISSTRTDDCQ